MVRMRFVQQAVEEIKKTDSNTKISVHFVRKLVKAGLIPSIDVGSGRKLINFDALLKYLEAGEAGETENKII